MSGINTNVQSMETGQDRSIIRRILRKSFGNRVLVDGKVPIKGNHKITPFRAAFHAGDMFGTINKNQRPDLPRINPVSGLNKPRLSTNNGGGVKANGESGYSGNPKYVYDSSDYIRYKKLKENNKIYK